MVESIGQLVLPPQGRYDIIFVEGSEKRRHIYARAESHCSSEDLSREFLNGLREVGHFDLVARGSMVVDHECQRLLVVYHGPLFPHKSFDVEKFKPIVENYVTHYLQGYDIVVTKGVSE